MATKTKTLANTRKLAQQQKFKTFKWKEILMVSSDNINNIKNKLLQDVKNFKVVTLGILVKIDPCIFDSIYRFIKFYYYYYWLK